jgi:hypothetical protein
MPTLVVGMRIGRRTLQHARAMIRHFPKGLGADRLFEFLMQAKVNIKHLGRADSL